MFALRECSRRCYFQNTSITRGASCQATGEPQRSAGHQHRAPRAPDHIAASSCSWCGCFQWQCEHRHRHQGRQRRALTVPAAAAASAGDAAARQRVTVASSSISPSDVSCGPLPATDAVSGAYGEAPERTILPSQLADALPPPRPLSQRQQQQCQEQQQQDVDEAAAEQLQSEPRRQPRQSGDRARGAPPARPRQYGFDDGSGSGLGQHPPPPRRAWDPGPGGATAQSRVYDAGPGPPPLSSAPPALEPRASQQSSETPQAPLEPFAPQRSLELGDGGDHAPREALGPLAGVAASTAADAGSVAVPVMGPGAGAAAAVTAAAATAGAAFRAALRACRCLDDVEALLDGGGPLPTLSSQQQPLPPAVPPAESLSVPSLTAAISALPRLPEACSAAGRRRLRQLLAARLTPLVLAAARRGELDGAGAAIMAAALAQLGPEVATDPRVGGSDLLDALAAAGLAACRLPMEPSGWRREGQGSQLLLPPQPLPQQKARVYGHSPRSYSTLLHGLAKVGYRPDDVWLERYLAASSHWGLRAFPPRDLAAVIWALAALQYRPGEAWLGALLSAWPTGHSGSEAVNSDSRRGKTSEDSGGGSGREDVGSQKAADPWVAGGALADAAPAGRRADAHSVSLMLWALWRLGVAAPPDWLDGAVALCAFPTSTTNPIATSVAAGAATASPTMSLRSRAAVPFPAATCQSLALMSYSLARMGHTPPARVREALVEAAGPLLQRGSAQDLVLLLVGVAHWPRGDAAAAAVGTATAVAVVPERWLHQLCLALRQRLAGCSAQALVLSLSALSYLSYSPGPSWLDEHEAALRPLIAGGRLDGRAAARVAAAWARLRHRPGRNVVDRLLKMLVAAAVGDDLYGGGAAAAAPTQQRRRWLSARLFAEGLYGIAVLVSARRAVHPTSTVLPPEPAAAPSAPLLAAIHLRALLAASQSRLPYSYLDEALLHLRAWRLLRMAPPHQWLANLAAVARAKLHAAPPGVLLELLRLLAWPGWRRLREPGQPQQLPPPPPEAAAAVIAPPPLSHGNQDPEHQRRLPNDGQYGSRGGGGGGLSVSAALVGAVAERLAAALPEMPVRQLADLAAALAALRVRPARSWLRGLLAALRSRIQNGEGMEPDLDLDPELDWGATDLVPDARRAVTSGAGPLPSGPAVGVPAGLRALRATAQLASAVGDPELQYTTCQLYGMAVAGGGPGLVAEAGAEAAVVVFDAGEDMTGSEPLQGGISEAPEPAVAGSGSPPTRAAWPAR